MNSSQHSSGISKYPHRLMVSQIILRQTNFINLFTNNHNIISNFLFLHFKDTELLDEYLLESSEDSKNRPLPHNPKQKVNESHSSTDLEERLEIMQNKIKSKKVKASARAIEKKKQKKLKKTKELQKKLISAAKSIKNEKVKSGKVVKQADAEMADSEDVKAEVKPDIKPAKTFNEEGKLVFSKFEFAAQPSRATKTKKDSKLLIFIDQFGGPMAS